MSFENFNGCIVLSKLLCLSNVFGILVDEDLIFGKCLHIYHRACIMQWMLDGHDECPNCRQLMWDPEAYNYVDECVKEHGLSTFVTKQ
jgi:Ring finger domain